ncbi:MAG TPA: hypothetical protein PKW33_13490 [Anaerolineaceae bacterium]|nr:hypothetical protein [Anaerolineaceae bacterium]HPN52599.1 hypothetical protein [Anaerolineaceae bacterium]
MYKATFSLDGHRENAAASFSLDLYQDWKNIYGRHSAVARNGKKKNRFPRCAHQRHAERQGGHGAVPELLHLGYWHG